MKRLPLLMVFELCFFLVSSHAWSKDIAYDRGAAITYARDHCGTSENTKYNFAQYKCYDALSQSVEQITRG